VSIQAESEVNDWKRKKQLLVKDVDTAEENLNIFDDKIEDLKAKREALLNENASLKEKIGVLDGKGFISLSSIYDRLWEKGLLCALIDLQLKSLHTQNEVDQLNFFFVIKGQPC